MIFIAGNHRSGTNLVHEIISLHPKGDILNEPFSLHNDFFPREDMNGINYEGGRALPEDILMWLIHLRNYMARLPHSPIRGVKETIMLDKIELLRTVFGECRPIWVIRDPLSIIASIISHPYAKQWNYEKSFNNAKAAKLFSRFYQHEPAQDCSIFEQICAIVRLKFAIMHQLMVENSNAIVFRIETYLERPVGAIEELMSFVGLEPAKAQLDFAKESSEGRGGLYSVYRAPSTVTDKWRQILSPSQEAFIRQEFEATRLMHSYVD